MGFLRRLLGGGTNVHGGTDGGAGDGPETDGAPDDHGTAGTTEEERVRERELLRADAARLEDPFLQRQLRYADRSWTPPPQGGERRADDRGAPEG
jgi:hypothetical protein